MKNSDLEWQQKVSEGFGRYIDTRLAEMAHERGETSNFHKPKGTK